ncbi:hypothetical protein IWX81_000065 [Salinibacterium sp. CAN_S4]|uniref:META domain-containing protein n=1 Tax=Salinibacterium sp. CAN_S4 TaxID=2787727 RepID=UPI0018EF7F15
MFRRLLAPLVVIALLAGCASTPPAAEVVAEDSPAIELVDLWRVTGAEGESADTWLRLDAGEFQLWRDCGMIQGSWRASNGLMLASVFGASGGCGTDTAPTADWLESVEGYVQTSDGFQLVDAAGSPVATLTIDGAPDPIPDAADFYAEAPEVTDETRAYFAQAKPLPGSLTPGSLEGQWAAEGVDASLGAGVDFAADGTWTGSDGCNGGSGRWAADASGGFLATSGVSTLMACEGALVPSWVAQAQLAGFDGDVLVLLDSDGVELGRLVTG